VNVIQTVAPDKTSTSHPTDPLWYKDAIIYQLHVRAFADSNNDGIGDLVGLTDKLSYLQDLGVNTLWLMPFYPSPGRDDGYDIADYGAISPSYGTMKEFRRFIAEAKRRGLRVITELVINHTSDQHNWFKRARRSPAGSSARNWYVWSDTDQKYDGTRIIFTDTEKSNWTWDPEANAYYWHRFFCRRLPSRCHSLPLRARWDQQREPSRNARGDQAAPRRARCLRAGQSAVGGGEPVAGGRAGIFRHG